MQKVKNDIITAEGPPDGGDLLPSQYFSSEGKLSSHMEAERSLMAAVLIDALRIYEKGVRRRKTRLKRFREVEEWFKDNDSEWPYSFLNICVELSLNPETIRNVLKRVMAEETKPIFWRKRVKIGGGVPVGHTEEDTEHAADEDTRRHLPRHGASRSGRGGYPRKAYKAGLQLP